jgi:cell division protein FtsZ
LLLIVSGSNEITLDEIEINDHIQNVGTMPILLSGGEDETLRCYCSYYCNGFDIEQQNGIVNTEPKKIIHTLEDEQRSVTTYRKTDSTRTNAEKTVSSF